MTEPLAERFRPKKIEGIVGQAKLLGSGGLIERSIALKKPLSMIFWGPPGCGKTTLAHAYAKAFETDLICLSAVSSGIADLKKVVESISQTPLLSRRTMLFIDEIHRYSRAQQDFLLPFVEKGLFILLGATTENPSFSLNSALLSRVRVVTLEPLKEDHLEELLKRYEALQGPLKLDQEARSFLLKLAQGDGRYLFNLLENIDGVTTSVELQELVQRRAACYDRSGDQHYNLISALHKSVRGSDPDAALYWLARMIEGGEDPLFIIRRIIRMASEDIGLADPQALQVAIATKEAYEMLGSPEGELMIAEAIVYMALAPKSNSIYTAWGKAKTLAKESGHLPPPKVILNAPTKLMKEEGYGKGYIYDHDTKWGCSGQNYFPDALERLSFYQPKMLGFEKEMKKRLEFFQKLRMESTRGL